MENDTSPVTELRLAETAGDCAIREVITVGLDATLRQAADLMRRHRINVRPVVTLGDELVGMAGIRDILRAPWPSSRHGGIGGRQTLEKTARALDPTTFAQVMVRRVITAREDTPVSQILADVVNLGVHPIPIVEGGRLTGLVSRNDLIALLVATEE